MHLVDSGDVKSQSYFFPLDTKQVCQSEPFEEFAPNSAVDFCDAKGHSSLVSAATRDYPVSVFLKING